MTPQTFTQKKNNMTTQTFTDREDLKEKWRLENDKLKGLGLYITEEGTATWWLEKIEEERSHLLQEVLKCVPYEITKTDECCCFDKKEQDCKYCIRNDNAESWNSYRQQFLSALQEKFNLQDNK